MALQPLFQQFSPLYVFGQAPGFEWTTYIDYWFGTDTMTWTVVDTGHVTVDGVPLRSMEVNAFAAGPYGTTSLSSGIIHERIGDLRFLFPWIMGACDSEVNGPLRCYSDTDITWQDPGIPQCALGTSVPERNTQGLRVQPTLLDRGGWIMVETDVLHLGPDLSIRISDLGGRILLERRITDPGTTLQMDMPGAFVITLTREGTPLARQRVVVR
jgi:hypothetical protein